MWKGHCFSCKRRRLNLEKTMTWEKTVSHSYDHSRFYIYYSKLFYTQYPQEDWRWLSLRYWQEKIMRCSKINCRRPERARDRAANHLTVVGQLTKECSYSWMYFRALNQPPGFYYPRTSHLLHMHEFQDCCL